MFHAPDIDALPDTPPEVAERARAHGYRAGLIAPLLRQGEWIGRGGGAKRALAAGELHGGRIWVDSELGVGSTFT